MKSGLASPSLLYSILTTSQFFPNYVATIITFFNCAFDASVFVFSIFKVRLIIQLNPKVIYDRGVPIGDIFIGYSTIALIYATGAIFWPRENKTYSNLEETENAESNSNKGSESIEQVQLEEDVQLPKPSPTPKLTQKQKFLKALLLMKKPEFPLILIFSVISMFWMNAHLGTAEAQLVVKMGKKEGAKLVQIFNGILPAGFLFTPFIGYLLDRKGMLVAFLVEVTSLSLFGLFNMFSIFWLHVVNSVIFTFSRGMLYSALCAYVAKE